MEGSTSHAALAASLMLPTPGRGAKCIPRRILQVPAGSICDVPAPSQAFLENSNWNNKLPMTRGPDGFSTTVLLAPGVPYEYKFIGVPRTATPTLARHALQCRLVHIARDPEFQNLTLRVVIRLSSVDGQWKCAHQQVALNLNKNLNQNPSPSQLPRIFQPNAT